MTVRQVDVRVPHEPYEVRAALALIFLAGRLNHVEDGDRAEHAPKASPTTTASAARAIGRCVILTGAPSPSAPTSSAAFP